MPEFGLINMTGRMYDARLARFLSPDPYVQMPGNTQNLNRYTYALNNPLVYTDPSGEFWHIVVGAAVGGVANLAGNWNNCDGFWEYATAFGVGAAVGAGVAATGGAAGTLATMGASGLGGAITMGTNDVIGQTGNNFSGMGKVDWEQVGVSAGIGAAAGIAGAAAGAGASSYVNANQIHGFWGGALVGGTAGAASGAVGGFGKGYQATHNLNRAFEHAAYGAAIGGFSGAAIGGTISGIQAMKKGARFWNGAHKSDFDYKLFGKTLVDDDMFGYNLRNPHEQAVYSKITTTNNSDSYPVEVPGNFTAQDVALSVRVDGGIASPVYQVQTNNVVTVHFPGGVNSSINGFIIRGYVPTYRSGWYTNIKF